MILGPNHSMMSRLTCTGHGAAAWMTVSSDERSYLVRTSTGSLSIRLNIVGTTWLWVMRWRSTSARYCSGSKRSMITDVPPRRIVADTEACGAEWYRGAGDR